MRGWLHKTHGPMFELVRHFLRAMFYTELGTTPDLLIPVLCGSSPVLLQWFFLLIQPLRHKYAALSRLPDPSLFRDAVRADELWLITLMMSAVALVAALKWPMLFPEIRDYRTLGTLPLRAWRI